MKTNNLFTLESRNYGYETYWDLEWCGTSFKEAIEEKNRMLDKYNGYDIFRIIVWIEGNKNQVFYFNGRNEVEGIE